VSNIRIRRGDTVQVISGREKGQRGEVLRLLPKAKRVLVQGIAMRKKHQRQVQAGGRTMSPGIIHFEAPIDLSNVQIVCPKCDELTRIGIIREDGERKRVCKKCNAVLDK
jgi:large subunit ribosomal protein L24